MLRRRFSSSKPKLTIGAQTAHQNVLVEIIAQHLESRGNLEVQRRLSVGSTPITYQALLMNEIDMYPESDGRDPGQHPEGTNG